MTHLASAGRAPPARRPAGMRDVTAARPRDGLNRRRCRVAGSVWPLLRRPKARLGPTAPVWSAKPELYALARTRQVRWCVAEMMRVRMEDRTLPKLTTKNEYTLIHVQTP